MSQNLFALIQTTAVMVAEMSAKVDALTAAVAALGAPDLTAINTKLDEIVAQVEPTNQPSVAT